MRGRGIAVCYGLLVGFFLGHVVAVWQLFVATQRIRAKGAL